MVVSIVPPRKIENVTTNTPMGIRPADCDIPITFTIGPQAVHTTVGTRVVGRISEGKIPVTDIVACSDIPVDIGMVDVIWDTIMIQ